MTTITIGTVTFDESSSLQNTGISVPGEDNNDEDVLLSVLQSGASAFYSRLFDATELNLSTTFANARRRRECGRLHYGFGQRHDHQPRIRRHSARASVRSDSSLNVSWRD